MRFVLLRYRWPVFIIYLEIYIQWPVQHIFVHMPFWKNGFMNNTLYPVNTGGFTMSIFEILYAISRQNTPAKHLTYGRTSVFIFIFSKMYAWFTIYIYHHWLSTCEFSLYFSENMPCGANHLIEKRRNKNCSFSKFIRVDLHTTHMNCWNYKLLIALHFIHWVYLWAQLRCYFNSKSADKWSSNIFFFFLLRLAYNFQSEILIIQNYYTQTSLLLIFN